MLSENGVALCLFELGELSAPKKITAKFIYVRLHGPGGPYRGKYSLQELGVWAEDFRAWLEQGIEIFCYFDNDQFGYAVENANQLIEITESYWK